MSFVFQGIIFMALGSFSFSLMNAVVKSLGHLSAMEIVFFRSFIMVVALLIIWGIQKPKVLVKQKGGFFLLMFRALSGGISMLLLFYNITTIPLGTASAFSQTMPLYVILFSALILREKPAFAVIVSAVIGFIGVILISDISGDSLKISNIIAGILGGVTMAAAFMSLKKLGRFYAESLMVMAFGAFMSVLSGVLMFVDIPFIEGFSGFVTPSLNDIWKIVLMGLLGTIGQILVTKAYMLAPAGIVSPIDYSRIAWGVFFGVLMGDLFPNLVTSLGIMLIILSGLMIAAPVFIRDIKNLKRRRYERATK